ncbi:TRAP transporter small permease [Chromohalobacter sp. 11-W]|uniref:TRAP transporter small permease n=1 Tax=Chromohalobacter sp. 11-W TaxID=2994061 RepID=UPI00246891C2|nr:TRAP transporter small permease [Chromohalobacter sp. 11-W]
MEKIRTLLDRFVQAFSCLLFVIMVVVATWQVVSRYVFNSPSTISEAFLRLSLVWLSMMAIAYVAGRREHVSLTLLTGNLSGAWKRFFDIFIELLFIAFAGFVMIYGGAQATSNTMAQVYPMLNVPKGIIYLSLPVSGAIIVVYCLMNCFKLYSDCQYYTRRQVS